MLTKPTPAEAKQTAYTIAALLAEQAERLRALEAVAGGSYVAAGCDGAS